MRGAIKTASQKPNFLKSSTARRALLAMVCVAGLAGGLTSASAQQGLDTSSVPRIAGSTDTYVSPAVTHFSTKQSVAETAEAAIKTLAAAGWQPYEAPFSSKADVPNQRMMSFKKGAQALSVFISIAPAQGNATSVQYGQLPVVTDLPFTKDATNTEFDPGRPHLALVTGGSIDQTLEFFRTELGARGWALWNAKEGVKQPAGSWPGEKTEKGGFAYYVRDQKSERPLLLTVNTTPEGKTKVELKSIPADVLRAQSERKPLGPTAEEKAAEAARVAAAKAESDKARAAHDAMSDAIMKQATQMIGDVMKDARAPARPQPPVTVTVTEAPLQALAGQATPVPLPATAEGVDYDAQDGELKFTSASTVQAVAAFHRDAMKPLGWKEGRSVINRPNMVVLDFTKDKKKVSFTIMQMGPSVNVSARGDGLISAKASAATDSKADTPATASAPVELDAEDKNGLPIPTQRASSSASTTPFRREVTADVNADINSVVAFYRRELGKRNWKEEPGASITSNEASLSFTSAEGPGVLKLTRKRSETAVNLTWRRTADAQKAGMLPKAGQSKLLFGNVLDKEASLTINKQTVKIGAGVGANGPDGPTLDLPPGKYKYSFKAGNGPAKTDEVEVAAGETWGMLIGPGGVLNLPVY